MQPAARNLHNDEQAMPIVTSQLNSSAAKPLAMQSSAGPSSPQQNARRPGMAAAEAARRAPSIFSDAAAPGSPGTVQCVHGGSSPPCFVVSSCKSIFDQNACFVGSWRSGGAASYQSTDLSEDEALKQALQVPLLCMANMKQPIDVVDMPCQAVTSAF